MGYFIIFSEVQDVDVKQHNHCLDAKINLLLSRRNTIPKTFECSNLKRINASSRSLSHPSLITCAEAMTKLSQTPPLRVIYKSEINQILTRVNEPLLPKREDRKVRQELKLLQLLGQLELLLEKMHRLELWKLKGGLSSMDSTLENLNKRASGIRIEIKNQESEVLLRKLKNEEPLYPKARRFVLADEPHLLLSETPTTGEQYHLDHLQQLYATACRLYHDLRLSNHKYIVYQLALLYQCINRQGVPFITYKGRIEQRFSEMVASSKKAEAVTLDKEQITWLQSLTLDVIMQVTDYASVAKCSELFNHISQITTTSIPP